MELDVKSGEKFIPEKYKFGSVQQRLDLLAGLMDTDGSASKNRITLPVQPDRCGADNQIFS